MYEIKELKFTQLLTMEMWDNELRFKSSVLIGLSGGIPYRYDEYSKMWSAMSVKYSTKENLMRVTPQITIYPDGIWNVIDGYSGTECLARGTWKITSTGKVRLWQEGKGEYRVTRHHDPDFVYARAVIQIVGELEVEESGVSGQR